jgi:hypothetical protein
LNDPATISGRVITQAGEAVSEFSVVCEALDASRGPARAQALGRNGQWSLTRLLPGQYRIFVSSEWGDGEASISLQPGRAVDSVVRVARNIEQPLPAPPIDGASKGDSNEPSPPSELTDGAEHTEG